MSEMISFGAGVNSVAMTIMLVEQGWRGPIVFADTGGELPETYCYLQRFEDKWLKPQGLEVTRISPATDPDLYDDKRLGGLVDTLEGYCLARGIIPLMAVRWCSVQFKRTPLDNWRKRRGIDVTCMGIAAEETRRIRDDPTVRYPLVEDCITRPECGRIIQRAGLPTARKTGCYFCPSQPLASWRMLYREHPDLYERACQLEDNAAANAQRNMMLDPHGKYTLRQHLERRWQGQMEMDLSDWLPCACRL